MKLPQITKGATPPPTGQGSTDDAPPPSTTALILWTTVSELLTHTRTLARQYRIRHVIESDRVALGSLYFAAYSRDIAATLEVAQEEYRITFEGEYGSLDLGACFVVEISGEIVGAIMTVTRAVQATLPSEAFIIDLMVNPAHQRKGLAIALLIKVAESLSNRERLKVGLRVEFANKPALRLYTRLGFRA